MRRRSDDWINATHILKVADFDKPARTRILEREVQKGTHEKVQGGYGKYQGTHHPTLCERRLTNVLKARGYHSQTAEPLLKRMASSKSCVASLTLFPETVFPLLLRNTRLPHRPNLERRAIQILSLQRGGCKVRYCSLPS